MPETEPFDQMLHRCLLYPAATENLPALRAGISELRLTFVGEVPPDEHVAIAQALFVFLERSAMIDTLDTLERGTLRAALALAYALGTVRRDCDAQ